MLRRPPRNLLKGVFFTAVPVILGLVIFLLPGRLIKINRIECESQYGDCPAEIGASLDNLDSTNLSNAKGRVEKLLSENPLVSDFSIQYSFPDRLKVNILLKKPRFSVFNKETGRYLMIGSKGEVLGSTDSSSLPTVIQSGDTPNLRALELVEGVYAMYQVSKGEITDGGLVVELPTGVRVIFPLDTGRDKNVLLGALRLIYSEVTDREIDLRFRNALLR